MIIGDLINAEYEKHMSEIAAHRNARKPEECLLEEWERDDYNGQDDDDAGLDGYDMWLDDYEAWLDSMACR